MMAEVLTPCLLTRKTNPSLAVMVCNSIKKTAFVAVFLWVISIFKRRLMFIITKKQFFIPIFLQNPPISGKLMTAMVTGAWRGVIAFLGQKPLWGLGVHEFKKYLHHNQNNDDI